MIKKAWALEDLNIAQIQVGLDQRGQPNITMGTNQTYAEAHRGLVIPSNAPNQRMIGMGMAIMQFFEVKKGRLSDQTAILYTNEYFMKGEALLPGPDGSHLYHLKPVEGKKIIWEMGSSFQNPGLAYMDSYNESYSRAKIAMSQVPEGDGEGLKKVLLEFGWANYAELLFPRQIANPYEIAWVLTSGRCVHLALRYTPDEKKTATILDRVNTTYRGLLKDLMYGNAILSGFQSAGEFQI